MVRNGSSVVVLLLDVLRQVGRLTYRYHRIVKSWDALHPHIPDDRGSMRQPD